MSKIKLIRETLQIIINNIDAGNSNLDDEQCTECLETLIPFTFVENKLSKYQSCKYLGVSRATFDNYVKDGKIPAGRKQQGFKEIFWYKKDLDNAKHKINHR